MIIQIALGVVLAVIVLAIGWIVLQLMGVVFFAGVLPWLVEHADAALACVFGALGLYALGKILEARRTARTR